MKNLLVPIGLSGNAVNTLQYAIDFAITVKAKIFVVRVYESTRVSGSLKNMNVLLEEESIKEIYNTLDNVDKKGVEVIAKSVKGQVIDSIEWLAEHLEIDLIISSAKSVSTDETLYLGKIPGSLVKDLDLPVLIVPAEYKFKPVSKILMAIKSGKIKPGNALNPIKDVIEYFTARVDLLQIITPRSTDDDLEVSDELRDLALSFRTSENATIFQGVLEHIHEFEPDMLCVIRRKRGFFTRLWEKDKVYKKDFESKIPLLVLKGLI